jgi:hypothetical protein
MSGHAMTRIADEVGLDRPEFSRMLRNVFAGSPDTMKRLEAVATFLNFPIDKIVIPAPPAWDERVPDRGWEKVGDGL